jgi:hypothetical protein
MPGFWIPRHTTQGAWRFLAFQKNRVELLSVLILLSVHGVAQEGEQKSHGSAVQKTGGSLESYLNMAGSKKAHEFRPLTQRERTALYLESLINPFGFVKMAMSAGLDQWNRKQPEWGQGVAGYAKRCANIEGQYTIRKTVTFVLSSPLHEDNRYFGSGKRGFWPRTGYALSSSLVARHDNGKRYVSISEIGGLAAGAFVARLWLPPSENSARDGAISFGITLGTSAAMSVVKEFLPDLLRRIDRKRTTQPPDNTKCCSGASAGSTTGAYSRR